MDKQNLKPYVVGVDIGGQTAKIGVVDRQGKIINQTVIGSQYGVGEADKFIQSLADAISQLIDVNQLKGIGIGAPCANYYSGMIENAVHLEWARYEPVNVGEKLSKLLNNVPVYLTNDANAAAMGEMTYGAAKGMKHFIEITLGTGVGSGIVINGEILYGNDGVAGELGHTYAVQKGGRECGCGRTGCLDAYATIIGVVKTAKELLRASNEPSELRNSECELTSLGVFQAAERGDKIAIEVFRYTGELLGECLAGFAHFSSPEAFILFGGLARAHKFMLPAIEESMNRALIPSLKGKIKVITSILADSDAAILGASALGW